jgi:hypothetical protein
MSETDEPALPALARKHPRNRIVKFIFIVRSCSNVVRGREHPVSRMLVPSLSECYWAFAMITSGK